MGLSETALQHDPALVSRAAYTELAAYTSLSGLYRLPFSAHDNPNGWLEITTHCNIRCNGCYRGCDRPLSKPPVHVPLEEVKRQVLLLRDMRNCQTISISGGEPLLHPELLEIVSFIKGQGLVPAILTNGSLLTVEKVRRLAEAGCGGIIVRVDPGQGTGAGDDTLVQRRTSLLELLDRSGINTGFTYVVNRATCKAAPAVLEWAGRQSRGVNLLLFILKRQIVFDKSEPLHGADMVALPEFADVLAGHFPGFRFNSFLGSTARNDAAKWLQAIRVVCRGTVLGYLDKKGIELFQTIHHLFFGTYVFFKKQRHSIALPPMLFAGFFSPAMRAIVVRFLRLCLARPWMLFSSCVLQTIVVVDPPFFVNGRRDLCDGCPDAMLYNGKLVPSCMLEEIKLFGHTVETGELKV
jgi:hypothetical protein